jgi:hypothetical protein
MSNVTFAYGKVNVIKVPTSLDKGVIVVLSALCCSVCTDLTSVQISFMQMHKVCSKKQKTHIKPEAREVTCPGQCINQSFCNLPREMSHMMLARDKVHN